jgi:phage replication O-like protein O
MSIKDNPGHKGGHTQVPNVLLEWLAKVHLPANCTRVLLYIIRGAYGSHESVGYIANSQIAAGTGLHKSVVSRCLRLLHAKGVITRDGKAVGVSVNHLLWPEPCLPPSEHHVHAVVDDTVNTQPKLAESPTKLAALSTGSSSPVAAQEAVGDTPEKGVPSGKPPDRFHEWRVQVIEEIAARRGCPSPNGAREARAITSMLKKRRTPWQILRAYDRMKSEPVWADKFLSMTALKRQLSEQGQ